MSANILELAERAWRDELRPDDPQPFFALGDLAEVAERTAFLPSFANVSAFETDDGLVLVDTGSPMFADHVYRAIREWSSQPVTVAVFTHGHIDHVFGVGPFEEESARNGWPRPRVVAHEAVPARFDRYIDTAGYNAHINRRQFGVSDLKWPVEYRYPDETYRDRLDLNVDGEVFELHHARGETDDHTWVWVPSRRVLCCGDFFIWASPNAGNPQKAQRYPKEWAAALREMAELDIDVMLPGHGFPIIGSERVNEALTSSAELLESLVEQTLRFMNEGLPLEEVVASVRVPHGLLEKPYLRPVYDEPEFVVRNLWRLYGGWYDGNPAHLKPAGESKVAAEIAALAGGAVVLTRRALELLESGDDRLAGHLARMAIAASPDDPEVTDAYHRVFARRSESEASTMARGIFAAASEGPSPGST